MCVLQSHRASILHDAFIDEHRGVNVTLEKAKRLFYWPKMRKYVHNYALRCSICQIVKVFHGKQQALLMLLPILERPFEDISRTSLLIFYIRLIQRLLMPLPISKGPFEDNSKDFVTNFLYLSNKRNT